MKLACTASLGRKGDSDSGSLVSESELFCLPKINNKTLRQKPKCAGARAHLKP